MIENDDECLETWSSQAASSESSAAQDAALMLPPGFTHAHTHPPAPPAAFAAPAMQGGGDVFGSLRATRNLPRSNDALAFFGFSFFEVRGETTLEAEATDALNLYLQGLLPPFLADEFASARSMRATFSAGMSRLLAAKTQERLVDLRSELQDYRVLVPCSLGFEVFAYPDVWSHGFDIPGREHNNMGMFANEPSLGETENCIPVYDSIYSHDLGHYTHRGDREIWNALCFPFFSLAACRPVLAGQELLWCYGDSSSPASQSSAALPQAQQGQIVSAKAMRCILLAYVLDATGRVQGLQAMSKRGWNQELSVDALRRYGASVMGGDVQVSVRLPSPPSSSHR